MPGELQVGGRRLGCGEGSLTVWTGLCVHVSPVHVSGFHLPLLWVLEGEQVVSLISIFQVGKLRPKGAHLAQVLDEPGLDLGTV